jgi:hypothetical protein
MYHYYQLRREEFEQHYHQRSNCESAFSMAKAKFKDSVRSRTDTAMVNEVLCKILCHNICCLIMSQLELGIEPVFWSETMPAVAEAKTVEAVVRPPSEQQTAERVAAIETESPATSHPSRQHCMMMCGA